MTPHDDVPAERGRDELRRNFAAWLDEWRYCPACDVQLQRSTGTEFVPTWHRHEDDCVLAGILALLAGLGAPAPAEATKRDAMDFCPTCKHPRWTTACQCAAEATEPSAPEPKGLHVYGNILPPDAPEALHVTLAPASGEPSGADAAVREALDAIKKARSAVDDLCNGRRWTMSIPARPDADHDLVIDDALTKAERVIRSLTDVPTAPGAPEEGRCGLPSPVRRYGPCILRRGHGGPGAHQHDETGRIMQAYHAPGYYRQWAEKRQREWAEGGPDTSEEGDAE